MFRAGDIAGAARKIRQRRNNKTAKPFTMYDSVNVAEIPAGAVAVAGYVNGYWPTYQTLRAKFPRAKRLSVAVSAAYDADCLDVERGDATNSQAPLWMRRQFGRGVKHPVVYTSVSNAAALVGVLEMAGIHRDQYRLWTAHYTYKQHLCDHRCGFGQIQADATQWSDHARGRNLDVSLCAPGFLP